MKTVHVAKASATRDHKPIEPVTLVIDGDLPDRLLEYAATRAEFREQAQLVFDALADSLPGGTWDALFALMADERASVLRVRPPQREQVPE